MKKPTLDILDAISPEYKNYQAIKPDDVRLNEYTCFFSLDIQTWDHFYSEISNVQFSWKEIKYSDVVNKKVSIDKNVPDSTGVYLFVVRPNKLVFDLPKYVFYVGIAGANSGDRTLKERIKDYFDKSKLLKRDQIRILIYKHFESVHIGYSTITLPSGVTLEEIEKSLIGFFGTHLLANRDDIPISLVSQSKAFNI